MILAAFSFASMAVCVKIASAWFNSAELVFWRGVLGMLFMWLLARRQGVGLATSLPGHARLAQRWSACSRWAPGSTPSPGCRWRPR